MPMAPRPAKRQRTSRVVSDDDDDYPPSTHISNRTPKGQRQLSLGEHGSPSLTLSPTSARTRNGKTTPKKASKITPSSAEKPRKGARLSAEPDKAKSIQNFFGKATEEQRWHRRKSNTPEVFIEEDGDAIEDDELPDEALLALEEPNSIVSAPIKKSTTSKVVANGKPTTNGSRFLKPSIPFKRPTTPVQAQKDNAESHPPWAERYGPITLDELAVHKKKVADVQQWFDGMLNGRIRQKLLILKGPAGSGKTTTASLVAKSLGLSPVFWQNPGTNETSINGSASVQFDDFLNRGGQFGSLAFEALDMKTESAASRQVLVVEEFPSSTSRSTSTDGFRSAVHRFLTKGGMPVSQPFRATGLDCSAVYPVVMIISETLLSSSTSFSDSFTAHRLLGPEILNHPSTAVIEFNSVAQTFVHKALDLAVKKEARDSMRRRIPGPAVMQKLAEMGDIRNAVNALEFLCVRDDGNSDWSGTVAGKGKKSSKDVANLTDMERDSLKLVSQRETTLDMFHAAGKVVYNKRDDPRVLDSRAEPPPKPPDHLLHLYNPMVSQVDIEALFNETGTDIQTFISTLYENYALSCNGDLFTDCLDDCAAMLSISDILNPDSRRSIRSHSGNAAINYAAMQTGSTDALRQDEISFNVAARGLIFSLPFPVKRAAPSSGRSGDSYKMFYPNSLRLWKPTEETDSLISLFAHDTTHAGINSARSSSGVASWKNVNFEPSQAPDAADEDTAPRSCVPSRTDLTLEVLPYLARIRAARKEDTKILSRITQVPSMAFQLTSDEPDDEGEPTDEAIVSSTKIRGSFAGSSALGRRPTGGSREGATNKRFEQKVASLSRSSGSRGEDSTSASSQFEALFLEEDDIVDD